LSQGVPRILPDFASILDLAERNQRVERTEWAVSTAVKNLIEDERRSSYEEDWK
jgi:hypothetical protein